MRATRMAQWDGSKLWTTSLPIGALPEKMCHQTPFGWSALATKVGNTLRQRYRTVRGAFKGRPPKRRRTKAHPRKPHLQLPKFPTRKQMSLGMGSL